MDSKISRISGQSDVPDVADDWGVGVGALYNCGVTDMFKRGGRDSPGVSVCGAGVGSGVGVGVCVGAGVGGCGVDVRFFGREYRFRMGILNFLKRGRSNMCRPSITIATAITMDM